MLSETFVVTLSNYTVGPAEDVFAIDEEYIYWYDTNIKFIMRTTNDSVSEQLYHIGTGSLTDIQIFGNVIY
jgi:hypothetical protein